MTGSVESHRGLGPQDHLCWVHDGPADYNPRLTEFFAEGLDHGLRVTYVATGRATELREDLSALDDLDRLLARGSVRIVPADDIYGPGEPVDPVAVVRAYAAATREALADGYRGLRVSVDVTGIVRTPEQQEAFAQYEVLFDRYAARHPVSALCGYHSGLGRDVLRQFAVLHPAAPAGLTSFQVFGRDDGAVGVRGELDLACRSEFGRALAWARPGPDEGSITLDLSAVEFIDHRAVLLLIAHLQASEIPVIIRALPPVARRLAELLGLDDLGPVQPEVA